MSLTPLRLRPFTRLFSSTSSAHFPPPTNDTTSTTGSTSKRPQVRRQPLGDMNIRNLEDYQFDEEPSLGFMRLEKIKENQELVRKCVLDKGVLQSQKQTFIPPTGKIRITSTIDLANPTSKFHVKKVLLAPISSLPLKGPEAIHRVKILAGPRWTPGKPGRNELFKSFDGGEGGETEGWIRISEERYPEGKMNRKSASDILERLVQAANDPKSLIPAETPLDTRHLLARQGQKKQRNAAHIWRRSEAMKARPGVIGGVKGFPAEWLKSQVQEQP